MKMHKCFLCNYFVNFVKRKKRKKGSKLRFIKCKDIESKKYIVRRFDKRRNEDNKKICVLKNMLITSNEFSVLKNENEILLLSSNESYKKEEYNNMINLNNNNNNNNKNISNNNNNNVYNFNDFTNSMNQPNVINNNKNISNNNNNNVYPSSMNNISKKCFSENIYVNEHIINSSIINCANVNYDIKEKSNINKEDSDELCVSADVHKINNDLCDIPKNVINEYRMKTNYLIDKYFCKILTFCKIKKIKQDLINLLHFINSSNNNNDDNNVHPLKKRKILLNNMYVIKKFLLLYKSYKIIKIWNKLYFLCFTNFCFNINRKDYFYKNILYQMKKKKCEYIHRQIVEIYIRIINILKLKRVGKRYVRKKNLFTINYSNITNQMRYEIMRNKYINVVICLCRIFFKYVDNILLCKKNMLKRYLYYYNKLKEPYYPYNNIKKDMVMEKRLIKNICSDYFNYIKKKRNELFHMSTGRYNFKNKPHDTNEPYIINISDLKNEKSEFGHIINLDNFYKNKKNENIFMSAPRKNRNNKKEEIGKKQKNTHKRNCKGIKYLYCRLKNNPDMIKIGRANKIKRPTKYKIKKKIKRIHCHNNFSEYLYKGIEGNIGQYKNEYFTTMNRTYLMKRKLKEHRVRIRKKYIEDIEPNVKKKKEPLYENVNENLCVHMNKNICVDMNKNICDE
ncbi:hypothetical protein PFMALIP_01651 [Plasmodium falciparum MaliPS096_E11]|uniref:Uncharacterized protein n=1 Tax=Plasmodium falciparum MaliPS096_E11 TaxID=1036727 RepID=A0A024WTR6_PLAFA|nr:hypothetical protein PFMALIP_01651 [Plasmodium falciparum MaliPS096_E11]